MNRIIVAGCWCSPAVGWLISMAATAGTWGPWSAMAVALTPVVVVLMTATLIAAAALRLQLLAGATLAVLVWSMVITSSGYAGLNDLPHPHASSSIEQASALNALVIVSSNVRVGNSEVGELISSVRAENPDVIVLQEIGDDELDAIRLTGLASSHPFEIVDARAGFFGGAVFSRWPMTGGVEEIGGYPMIVATVDSPSGAVDVVNVHVAPPISAESHRLWNAQLASLLDRLASTQDPLVVLGDFNATPQHRELRRLADVTSPQGLGAFASYPTLFGVPPVLSLDHAFAAGGVCIGRVTPLPDNAGSDHRAMRAIVHHAYSCPGEVPKLD